MSRSLKSELQARYHSQVQAYMERGWWLMVVPAVILAMVAECIAGGVGFDTTTWTFYFCQLSLAVFFCAVLSRCHRGAIHRLRDSEATLANNFGEEALAEAVRWWELLPLSVVLFMLHEFAFLIGFFTYIVALVIGIPWLLGASLGLAAAVPIELLAYRVSLKRWGRRALAFWLATLFGSAAVLAVGHFWLLSSI